MAETPIEAAAREVRLLLVTSGAINDYDAHYSGQKIVSAYLQACLADPATVERCCDAVHVEGDKPMFSNRSIVQAVIKALADDQ